MFRNKVDITTQDVAKLIRTRGKDLHKLLEKELNKEPDNVSLNIILKSVK